MKIIVRNRPDAEDLARTWNPAGRMAVISIRSTDEAPADIHESASVGPTLRLAFDDEDPNGGYRVPSDTCPMTHSQAETVANLVRALSPDIDTLLVHCEGGVSRSAGVAAAISKWATGDDRRFFHAPYCPNMWCYRLTLDALT